MGRYVVRAEIGAGGMGVVYLAQDTEHQREVALKTLPELDPAALYRFKREFRALADVTHPNLVTLYELASEDEQWFFAMELVLGQDFLTWARGGQRPRVEEGAKRRASSSSDAPPILGRAELARLRQGLRQIVMGLRALHGAGKIHCDLKPSNVLVTDDDRVVILDFGLVRERPRQNVDTTGELFGTALYMAPEQARSKRVGPTADWYALGVMLYQLLTGKSPFRGGPMEILFAKQESEPPEPSTVVGGVPRDLDDLCVALLHCAPAARPGSSEILEMLGAPVEQESGEARVDTSTFQVGSTFVGRAAELATLRRSFETSRQEPVAVFVRGQSGVGKTALVRAFLDALRLSRTDAVVLAGRCYERESVPYRALDSVVDELSDYLRRVDQAEAELLVPADAILLSRVFPVLGRVPAIARAESPHADVRDPRDLRTRTFNSLRELLRRIAECAPVVVFVDDLQWADADGLALIAEVLHGPEAPTLLFIATVRGDSHAPLPEHLQEVAVEISQVVDLPIGPLPPDYAVELAELLCERTGTDPGVDAESVAADAGGHPQFIDELVHFLSTGSSGLDRATGLDDALWARIQRLEKPARALLETLAIADVPLSAAIACQAAGLLGEGDSLVRLLAGDHLIRSVPLRGGTHGLEPYHERVRETVIHRLEESALVERHRRLADALQEAGAALNEPQALVTHLISAGEEARAAEQAAEAARRADLALGFDQAAEMYRIALKLGRHSDSDERDLRMRLAEALINAGRGVEAAAELISNARNTENKGERIDCQRRAAQQLLLNGHIEDGLEVLNAVASEIGLRIPATPRRALLSYLWTRFRLRIRGMRWKQRDESEIPSRSLMELDLYHALGTILGLVDAVRGQALHARSVLLALQIGEPDRVVRALSTEATSAVAVGDRRRAKRLLVAAQNMSEGKKDPMLLAWPYGTSGLAAFMAGNFRDTVPLLERGLALRAVIEPTQRSRLATGGAYEANVMRSYRLLALAYLGECARLRREFHEFLRDAHRRGDRFSAATVARGLNFVWLMDDEPERARRALDEEVWTPPTSSYHVQHFLALRAKAHIHLYVGTAREGRVELQPEIEAVQRALLLRLVPIRVEHSWMMGRMALAEVEEGADRRRNLRLASAMARKLERVGLGHAAVAAVLLRAGILSMQGQHDRAIGELARAEALATRGGLKLIAATALRRRGQLFGGVEGERLVETADRWMIGETIRSPERITRMYTPGFDARPALLGK